MYIHVHCRVIFIAILINTKIRNAFLYLVPVQKANHGNWINFPDLRHICIMNLLCTYSMDLRCVWPHHMKFPGYFVGHEYWRF